MPDDLLRFLGYGRQSLARPGENEASSLSLRGQADLFTAECARHRWESAGFIVDHDLKGDDPNRPGIHELLERVKSGNVDGVWVTMLNRFSNDYIWQGLTWRQLKQLGVSHLVSYVEGPVEDEFILGIHGLVAGKRITELRVHLKNAFARRAKDGEFPVGATPLGYQRPHRITATRANGTTYQRQTGTPAVHPGDADLVRHIFDRFAAGDSLQVIAQWLDDERVPAPRGGIWRHGYVKKILQNPIYAGDVAHRGVVVAHNDAWQLVPRDLWDRVQERFGRYVIVRGTPDHWLEGLVRHACGQRMYFRWRSALPQGPTPRGDYVCRTTGLVSSAACGIGRPRIANTRLDPAVRTALVNDLSTIATPAAATAKALELAGGRDAIRARGKLDNRLRDAEAEHARMVRLYRKGHLSDDEIDREYETLHAERAAVESARLALPHAPDPGAIADVATTLHAAAHRVPAMTEAELRGLLSVFGHVDVSADGVRITYHIDPFALFIKPTTVPLAEGKVSPL